MAESTRRDDLLVMLLHGGASTNSIARYVVDAFAAEVRAEVLREAADRVAARQRRSNDREMARFGKLDHESALERDVVLDVVADLREMASSPSPAAGEKQPETCTCGPQMRCKNGHCSRHYTCQDCGCCCSCECAGGAR